jgi:hypothetical protein
MFPVEYGFITTTKQYRKKNILPGHLYPIMWKGLNSTKLIERVGAGDDKKDNVRQQHLLTSDALLLHKQRLQADQQIDRFGIYKGYLRGLGSLFDLPHFPYLWR